MSKQDKLRKEIELVNSKINRLYWWRSQLESKFSALSLKSGTCSATLLHLEDGSDVGYSGSASDGKPVTAQTPNEGRRDFYDL